MSNRTISLTEDLYTYLLSHSLREPAILAKLRKETAAHPESEMQIAPEQGQFMALLVRLMGARRTLEVGVFTGYSSLAVALALPEDGHVTACDVSDDYTKTARRYWKDAGVAHKVDLRVAPARDTLASLLEEGQGETYDLAFIDADKTGYDGYYEQALLLVRRGGLIILDNMLRGGRVADPTAADEATVAIRALNAKLRSDDRVDLSLLPVADGLVLALRR